MLIVRDVVSTTVGLEVGMTSVVWEQQRSKSSLVVLVSHAEFGFLLLSIWNLMSVCKEIVISDNEGTS